MESLSREQIIEAMEKLDGWMATHAQRAQIYMVGGAVMCVVHRARPSTKDVDAWFTEPGILRTGARLVAAEMGLPEDWLNDAAKAFIPGQAGFELWMSLSHLDISVADDRTLLAMKCAAARTTEDVSDIRFLVRKLGLSSSEDVLNVVLAYYSADQLPVRAQLLLEEMLNDGG